MNDVRPLAGLQHELQRRLAEERKPCNVVIRAVQMPTPEEALLRVRLDEEALAAVDPAEPHRAMNRAGEPRHPQIVVGDRQPVDPVIAQAVVLGQHDLDRVAPQLKLPAEPEHDITEPTGVRDRRALGSDHHDEHEPTTSADHARTGSAGGIGGCGRGRDGARWAGKLAVVVMPSPEDDQRRPAWGRAHPERAARCDT